MKNKLMKLLFFAYLVLFNTIIFAQNNDPIPDNTEPESPDDTPISTHLIWLGLAGLAFAFYYYANQKKKHIN